MPPVPNMTIYLNRDRNERKFFLFVSPNTAAVSADLIQESLYDALGFAFSDERRKLHAAAFKIALDEALDYMKQGIVALLEYLFDDRHKEDLAVSFKNKTILKRKIQ